MRGWVCGWVGGLIVGGWLGTRPPAAARLRHGSPTQQPLVSSGKEEAPRLNSASGEGRKAVCPGFRQTITTIIFWVSGRRFDSVGQKHGFKAPFFCFLACVLGGGVSEWSGWVGGWAGGSVGGWVGE